VVSRLTNSFERGVPVSLMSATFLKGLLSLAAACVFLAVSVTLFLTRRGLV